MYVCEEARAVCAWRGQSSSSSSSNNGSGSSVVVPAAVSLGAQRLGFRLLRLLLPSLTPPPASLLVGPHTHQYSSSIHSSTQKTCRQQRVQQAAGVRTLGRQDNQGRDTNRRGWQVREAGRLRPFEVMT